MQCQKNELFRKHMLLLWQNNVPMSVEVLMSPECRSGAPRAGLAVTTMPEAGSVLLEQWTVAVLPAGLASGPHPPPFPPHTTLAPPSPGGTKPAMLRIAADMRKTIENHRKTIGPAGRLPRIL